MAETFGAQNSRDEWAAQIAALEAPPVVRKEPLSADRIVATALELVEAEGFDALTMRRVAAALHTGPGSLYAHVRNKAQLDDLLIGRLCTRVELPSPDPDEWRRQYADVCRQLRDQYIRYPGISRAALTAFPTSLDTLRVGEGLFGILLMGGVEPQTASWVMDATLLYIAAYCLEVSARERPPKSESSFDRDEVIDRLRMLPPAHFPLAVAHADVLIAGEGSERFDFALGVLLRGAAAT